jgi:hypothetical protein
MAVGSSRTIAIRTRNAALPNSPALTDQFLTTSPPLALGVPMLHLQQPPEPPIWRSIMPQSALRPLSTGEILDVAFGLYRRLFGPLVTVALVCTGIPLLLNVYMTTAGGSLANIAVFITYLIASVVLSAIATAATVFIVSESYLGRTRSASEALRLAMPFVGRLFLLSLLTSLVVGLGFLLLIIPGLILLSGLIVATSALVLEGLPSATDAMGRAWELTRGYRLKMFGLVFTMFLIIYIPAIALGAVAAIFMQKDTAVAVAANINTAGIVVVVVTGLAQMLIYPLFYTTLTVAYYDLRVRKEGFDLEVLAGALQPA